MTNSNPGISLPDVGISKPPTPEQQEAARAYVVAHGFTDEATILAMLGLDQ